MTAVAPWACSWAGKAVRVWALRFARAFVLDRKRALEDDTLSAVTPVLENDGGTHGYYLGVWQLLFTDIVIYSMARVV